MADEGDNSWASSWAASLGLSPYQPITQTQQDSSSSYYPSYATSSPYYPHSSGFPSHLTNPVPQQVANDDFLNLSLACGDSSHQTKGKEPASYSYTTSSHYPHNSDYSSYYTNPVPQQQENNPVPQQQANDDFLNLSLACGDWSSSSHQRKGKEPASYSYTNSPSHYPQNSGYSSYSTNPVPQQQQENYDFLNLSLSRGEWFGSSYQSKGKEPVNDNQALNLVSTQLTLGRDSLTSTNKINWSIRKKLKDSDVDYNGTLMLPIEWVRDHILPLWDANSLKHGKEVSVWDCDTNTEHQFTIKLKSKGSYVIRGRWSKDFVKRRKLKKGSEIGLYWDPINSRFDFCVFD